MPRAWYNQLDRNPNKNLIPHPIPGGIPTSCGETNAGDVEQWRRLSEVLNDLCASIEARASPVTSMTQKQCSEIPGELHRAIYLLLAGIVSLAMPALARANAAQANISIRNPKTNAWEMELRITAATAESKSEGRSRPASLIAFDRTY